MFQVILPQINTTKFYLKVSKVKCSNSMELRGFVRDVGEKFLNTDGEILFVNYAKLNFFLKTLLCVKNTAKHNCCVKRIVGNDSSQMHAIVLRELVWLIVSWNISLEEPKIPRCSQFLEEYTKHPVTDLSTLRTLFLHVLRGGLSQNANECFWPKVLDVHKETIDHHRRYVANVAHGTSTFTAPPPSASSYTVEFLT